MTDDSRVWICKNCFLEFDIEDPSVRLVVGPTKGHECLIIVGGQAHSLIWRQWADVQRLKKAQSKSVSVYTIQGEEDFTQAILGEQKSGQATN